MGERASIEAPRLREVCGAFGLGALEGHARLGTGHIHSTFALRVGNGAALRDVVAQQLNESVFPDLVPVMQNLERIAAHPAASRWVAPLLRTPEGRSVSRDSSGAAWRVFERIAGGVSHDVVDDGLAREAGRAFAAFSFSLADLPLPPLDEPLPGFHDTNARRAAFEEAVVQDPLGRAAGLAPEIAALRDTGFLAGALDGDALPRRVTHNDTKINNVLFEAETRVALAVVDLDTVAPGLLAWDFGDLVRSAANAAPEDAPDPASATLRLPRFAAVAEGWFTGAAGRMTADECRCLVPGALVMTYELALRFATDWLLGDVYFRIADPEHNLRRIRVQLNLLRSMQAQREEMAMVVEELARA